MRKTLFLSLFRNRLRSATFFSFCVTLSFIVTSILAPVPLYAAAFATSPVFTSESNSAYPLSFRLRLPLQFVKIDESYNPSSRKLPEIIFIADAHANLDAQKQIAAFLEHQLKGSALAPSTILVEGSGGTVDTSLLSYFPDIAIRNLIANDLLQKLRISGAEFFTATNPDLPVNIQGIEAPELYKKNLEAFQTIFDERVDALRSIEQFQQEFRELESSLYSDEFRRFADLKRRADQHTGDAWVSYITFLTLQQKVIEISADRYPTLAKLKEMKQPVGNDFEYATLGSEITHVEKEIVRKSVQSYESSMLYALTSKLDLFKRALRLMLSPQEAAVVSKNVNSFSFENFEVFLKRTKPTANPINRWDSTLINSVTQFYKLAHKRDKSLSANILKKRDRTHSPTFVITGGFHRHGITRRLRRAGLSYIVLTPLIHAETNQAVYQHHMNSAKPSDTLAMASPFDLEPTFDENRVAAFQSSLVSRLLTVQTATGGVNRSVLLGRFESSYFRTLHARNMNLEVREQLRARAQKAFDHARRVIELHTPLQPRSRIASGFGYVAVDAQAGNFEIDRIRQVIKSGRNNIVFFGGGTNIKKTLKTPLQKFFNAYVPLSADNAEIKIPVLDARKVNASIEMLRTLLERPPFEARLAKITKRLLGREQKRIIIIQNFHLIGRSEKLRDLIQQFLSDKANFLVAAAPANAFDEVESTWGNDAPLHYSWRPLPPDSKKSYLHRKRKAVIFGASGFAGQAAYQFLKTARNEIVGTYLTGEQLPVELKREMRPLDVTNKKAVQRLLDDEDPDDIFYFAGDTNLDQLQKDPARAYAIHAAALRNLEAFFKRKPNARLIYISTDAVFSGNLNDDEPGYISSSPTSAPRQGADIQHYAQSKIEGEILAQRINPDHFVIVRLPYLVGINQIPFEARKPKLAEMIIKALDARVVNGQEEIPLDNTRVRQPFLIDLIGNTLERLLMNNAQGIYQLAGPASLTEFEFAQAVATEYAHMYPFVGFEKPSDHLKRTFKPVEVPKYAPRGKRSLMVPSDLPIPLESIIQHLISEISSAGRGSGRSVVIDREAGTVLKRSAEDRRGKEKLREEIKWLQAARQIPTLRDHVPEIVRVLDTPDKVELVIKKFNAPSIIEGIIEGKITRRSLRRILTHVYGFMAKEMYKQKLADTPPSTILEEHHIDRMLDRLIEYREKAKRTESRKSMSVVTRLTKQDGVKVNRSSNFYPNLLHQLHRLHARINDQDNTLFRKAVTPPKSAVVFAHADPHLGNILFADFIKYMFVDPKGHFATDYLYDAAKVIHDFVGKFQLFNYGRFDVDINDSPVDVSVDFEFDPHDKVWQLLDKFAQSGDMSRVLLSTIISKERRTSDPYWFIRLAFTHAVLWSSIAPFQVRGDNVDTSVAVYAYGLQVFQEFFELYDAWASGQLKKFVDEKGGRYLGFTFHELQEAGFPVDGPTAQTVGFGSAQTVDDIVKPQMESALAQIESMAGDTLPFSSEQALEIFKSDYSRLEKELQKVDSQASLIITDEKHLPNSFSAIENQIRSGRLAFTFRGTKEEGKRFFEKKFQQPFPEGFVEVLAYQDNRLVPQLINEYVQTNADGAESAHTVSYFGQEHPKVFSKLLRGTYRVYALDGSIGLLEWDVLRLLSMVGNEHPAVRPFLLPFSDRGVLKIASIGEYLYQAIQSHERIAIAA